MKVRYGLRFTRIHFSLVLMKGTIICVLQISLMRLNIPLLLSNQPMWRYMKITGLLSIKDITQELVFTAKYLGSVPDPMGNTKAGFEMDTVFDRKDFNITWNQFFDKQGILISDQVKLHADVQLLKLS